MTVGRGGGALVWSGRSAGLVGRGGGWGTGLVWKVCWSGRPGVGHWSGLEGLLVWWPWGGGGTGLVW